MSIEHEKREGNCRIVQNPGWDTETPSLWAHGDCPVCRAERAEARVKELEAELRELKTRNRRYHDVDEYYLRGEEPR